MKAYVVTPSKTTAKETPKLPPKAEKPAVDTAGKYGPTITLNPSSKWPFRFGPAKARLILEHLAPSSSSPPTSKITKAIDCSCRNAPRGASRGLECPPDETPRDARLASSHTPHNT